MTTRRQIIWLIAVAFAARLAIFILMLGNFGPGGFYLANRFAPLTDNDSQNYVTIAKNLAEGNGYSRFAEGPFEPDSFRTPLLPLYFTPFISAFGFKIGVIAAMLVLIAILSLTAAVAYKFARLFLQERYSFWFALLIALEPLLVYRSNIAEPDGLIVLLLLLAMYFFTRFWKEGQVKYLYGAGLLLGILCLAKPVGIYVICIVGIFAFMTQLLRGREVTESIRNLAVYFTIAAVVVGPWVYRNHKVFGAWSTSSITMYNFYNYYTDKIRLPTEPLPKNLAGRDSARDLRNEKYFMKLSLDRIKAQPFAYAKAHVTGTVKNLLASDLPGIYNNGHSRILPFAYNPHGQSAHPGPVYILRHLFLAGFYLVIAYHWIKLYPRDKNLFWLFTMFLAISFYFVFVAGNFVDAKYRLPVLPLLILIFLHFWQTRRES